MIDLLRYLDSGPYHARKGAVLWDRPAVDILHLKDAVDAGLAVYGKYGYTLTVKGFHAAWPNFQECTKW